MQLPPETWQQLHEPASASLLEQAAACGLANAQPANINTLSKLRKQYDADLVSAAFQLCEARTRAVKKFGDRAADLLADVEGVEQASSLTVAKHKANRFADLAARTGQNTIADLCCGIGGDAMAFADASLNVTAIDNEPTRTLMAGHNAHCQTMCCGVDTWLNRLEAEPALFHIDPARRSSAGRTWRFADYTPHPDFLRRLITRLPNGAIKLGPGIDQIELAEKLTDDLPDWELEFISEHGRLVQAVLWTGDLANQTDSSNRHALSATLLPANSTISGQPDDPPLGDIESFLYTVDAAAERAQLLHVLCEQHDLLAIHPALGILTCNTLVDSPWLTTFEFVEELPWRLKKVKAWLNAHDAGIIEVKTRGKAVNPDDVQRQLRGKGNQPYTVFILRFDQQVRALITKRLNRKT